MKYGAFIIPTGIGASIGGFAGDASKWARRLSQKCKLLVNPNVVNAGVFSGITDNMLYVEGHTLNQFFKGECNLIETTVQNKIGVIFDKAISKKVLNIHINTINAVKTVYDINIIDYAITKESVGVEFYIDKSGVSTGNIKNLDTIKESATELIKKGANALAIVCHFPEEQGSDYSNGIGVDPIGGVEAIISHYISKEFSLPCAHAPAFSNYEIDSHIVDERCAAEYITPTYLPCILLGLNKAPQISREKGICNKDISFIVTPYDAVGGVANMEMARLNKKNYTIKENKTVLNVTPENFSIKCDIINTYEELLELI